MTKTFFTVADDYDGGLINIAGHPGPYEAGDLIVIDSDSEEQRAIRDTAPGNDGALTNISKQRAALTALVTNGDITYGGELPASAGNGATAWSLPISLSSIANGEVARIKPGFDGRVAGYSFLATADATTSSKAATLGLSIEGDDASDEITLLTQTGTPTGGSSDVEISADGEVVGEINIAFDDTVPEVQAKIDAEDGLDGNVTAGGSTDAWTLAYGGDLADTDITVVVDDNLTGGTAPALTATTTVAGGGARLVGASGNPATLDLTSAAVTNGGVIAGETIATGSNANHGNFSEDDEIIITASSVTTFIEGAGVLTV